MAKTSAEDRRRMRAVDAKIDTLKARRDTTKSDLMKATAEKRALRIRMRGR